MRIPTKEEAIAWAKANPRLAIAAAAVAAGAFTVLLASVGIVLFAPKPTEPAPSASVVEEPTEPAGTDWLDGTPSDGGALRPFAVMIENHTDSRPPSGLAAARLVFEAPVEGGITRFLAVFSATGTVPEIGPVRSARPYFLDWAEELGADYVHVGGSPEAFSQLARRDINDIDEFAWGATAFWRSSRRYAPHNAYTSLELLQGVREERGWSASSTAPAWRFSAAPEGERTTSTQSAVIEFSAPSYRVEWRWLPEDGGYRRIQARDPHSDKDGTPIIAANVVVLRTDAEVVDAVGRLRLRTTGQGPAWVLRDGRLLEVRWKKASAGSRLRFEHVDGKEVVFAPGPTWIEVVTRGMPVRSGGKELQ